PSRLLSPRRRLARRLDRARPAPPAGPHRPRPARQDPGRRRRRPPEPVHRRTDAHPRPGPTRRRRPVCRVRRRHRDHPGRLARPARPPHPHARGPARPPPAGSPPGPPPPFVGLGGRGNPAEAVADEAVAELLAFLETPAGAVDPHSADQLLLPLALAPGRSEYT